MCDILTGTVENLTGIEGENERRIITGGPIYWDYAPTWSEGKRASFALVIFIDERGLDVRSIHKVLFVG